MPPSIEKPLDASAHLADGNCADVEPTLMLAQPPHDLWIGFRLYGFAENIGVDEESHSIGTDKLYKKPVQETR